MRSATQVLTEQLLTPEDGISDKQIVTPPKGVIRIPLPKEYNAKMISGGPQIIQSLTNMMITVDRMVTTVNRLPGAFESVYADSSTVGAVNLGLSANSEAAIAYYVLLAVHALYAEHITRVEQKRKDKELQNIYKLFEQKKADKDQADEQISEEAEEYRKRIIWDQIKYNIQNYLEQIRKSDKALQEKYSSIVIDDNSNELVFTRNPPEPKEKRGVFGSFWENVVKPLHQSGGFASFAFWLLWITAAAYTGVQLEGVAGIAPWVAVGIPTGFGLLNLGVYLYKAVKHGGFEKARQHDEAAADFDVMLKALLTREHEREIEYLQKRNQELSAELEKRGLSVKEELTPGRYKNLVIQSPNGVLDKPLVKGAFTIGSNSASNWNGTVGLTWYYKVLVETAYAGVLSAPLLGTVVGSVMLGLSCAVGIYNGYKRYSEAKVLKAKLQSEQQKPEKVVIPLDTFEQHYKLRLAYLEQLKVEMHAYKEKYNAVKTPHYVSMPGIFDGPEKNPKDEGAKSFFGKAREKIYDVSIAIKNHPLVDAWDISLSGIFLGRVLFTTAAPFLLAPILPIAAAGPIGVAAILAVGLAFLAVKWYEKYQIKKEQRIKQLPSMLDAAETQIQEAELTVKDMRKSQCLINDDVLRKDQKTLTGEDESKGLRHAIHRKLFDTSVVRSKEMTSKRHERSVEADDSLEYKKVVVAV